MPKELKQRIECFDISTFRRFDILTLLKPMKTITPAIILILQLLAVNHVIADQQYVHGRVYELEQHHDHHHMYPLVGAHVVWLGTSSGVATDEEGAFDLPVSVDLPHKIVVSYIGYRSDTLMVENTSETVSVVLEARTDLDEVEVTGRVRVHMFPVWILY